MTIKREREFTPGFYAADTCSSIYFFVIYVVSCFCSVANRKTFHSNSMALKNHPQIGKTFQQKNQARGSYFIELTSSLR